MTDIPTFDEIIDLGIHEYDNEWNPDKSNNLSQTPGPQPDINVEANSL